MKILNFASCNIDFVYSLDHIVAPGETETSSDFNVFPGGKGLNQSIAIARAGGYVYHAGCVGNDGEILLETLKKSGVDVSYVRAVDIKNGHAIIQVSSKGENSIFLFAGSNECVSREMVDEILLDFGAGDMLLLQNEISNVDYIIKKAYEKNICIVFNPSPFNDKLKDIDYNMISYVMVNEVEARGISGCNEPEQALAVLNERYPELKVVLTLGKNGSVFFDGESKVYQPAYKVEVKDTTAAGDTFTGYFVSEIAKGSGYKQAMQIASAASAIAVSRMGASSSIPTYCEVENALKGFQKNRSDGANQRKERKIVEYIEQNLKEADINELSEILGYSHVYTSSLVKKLSGKTFSELLKAKRCASAARMLLETDLPISEIISEIGYENQSFFRKMFKQTYGETPLQYRKNRS